MFTFAFIGEPFIENVPKKPDWYRKKWVQARADRIKLASKDPFHELLVELAQLKRETALDANETVELEKLRRKLVTERADLIDLRHKYDQLLSELAQKRKAFPTGTLRRIRAGIKANLRLRRWQNYQKKKNKPRK